jgi:hypothetical protein
MISFDQFIGLLRSSLLDTKGVEVALNPHMPTHWLFMNEEEWQHFARIASFRLDFQVKQSALSSTSTILDLYYASVPRLEQFGCILARHPVSHFAKRAHSSQSAPWH